MSWSYNETGAILVQVNYAFLSYSSVLMAEKRGLATFKPSAFCFKDINVLSYLTKLLFARIYILHLPVAPT